MTGLVTVFGGNGFVGRYVVRDLLSSGWRVRVASRNPSDSFFLKPQGGLGQTEFVGADVTKPATIARALSGAGAVVNLVGSFAKMDAIQHEGAANVAAAAKAAGVKQLVHISAIGADRDSASRYGSSKGRGEDAVRAAYPQAIILRPSIIFGREDQFINRFAKMIRIAPIVPVVRAAARFQPVFVGDVANAVTAALTCGTAGKTYELGGPDVMTMAEIMHWIADQIGAAPSFLPVPDPMMAVAARLTGWMPGAPITKDQWLMLQHDTVVTSATADLESLAIRATPLQVVAPGWLDIYRAHGRFTEAPKHTASTEAQSMV